jgi:hypothetical protein
MLYFARCTCKSGCEGSFGNLKAQRWKFINFCFNCVWLRMFQIGAEESCFLFIVAYDALIRHRDSGMFCCRLRVALQLWCSRTGVSKSSLFAFPTLSCAMCFLLYNLYFSLVSLSLCVSLEYTQNIYDHILEMDCVLEWGRSFNCSIQIHF